MKFLKVLITVCLCSSALLGDYVVFQSKFSNSLGFRAVADSAVHAAIGLFSSLLFFSRDPFVANSVYNVLLCTAVSSIIDIDHFIVARSIFLKDLINLKQRGIFHCTTFWILLTSILLLICCVFKKIDAYDLINLKQRGIFHCTTFWILLTSILLLICCVFKKIDAYVSTWMFIIAFTSHHIRDANRRGFWVYPFGHTSPISKHVYVTLLATLPHIFSIMCVYMKPVLEKPFEYVTII